MMAGSFDNEFVSRFANTDIAQRPKANASGQLTHIGGDGVASNQTRDAACRREGELVDCVWRIYFQIAADVSGLERRDGAREPRGQG